MTCSAAGAKPKRPTSRTVGLSTKSTPDKPSQRMAAKKFNALPGFNLTIGFTLFYLSAIVLIPIGGLIIKVAGLSWAELWRLATTERAMAAYKLTFGASFVAALANGI